MMGNIAIIGASYLQLPLITKAKEMGYTTHVFAWKTGDVGEKEADFFYPISIVEKEKILAKCRELDICGICSIASDLAIITVNYVANAMGLPANSMEATYKSTNKHLMRETFAACGDPSPHSFLVDNETDFSGLEIRFPAIVKPTDRSGSRGICKVNCTEEIASAVKSAVKESFEGKALVEEFAEGQEYSVEYISHKRRHHFLALTLKYTTGAPHFIETGHREPAPVGESILKKVRAVVEHALDSLGLEEGASHSEIKIAEDGAITIIEIGGRMGGDCIGSDLVHFTTGVDFVRAVIQVACGEEPNLVPDRQPQPARVVYIFNEKDQQEFERIKAEEPEKILRVVDDRQLLQGEEITDSSNRAGCYIIVDND
jgi:biotin carboxylase